MRLPTALLLLAAVTCDSLSRASPARLLLQRLAQDQTEAAATASSTQPNVEPVICDEGIIDDDATLAANPMAATYGITSCAQAHDMLMQWASNVDLLCKSLGAGVCNCTCSGIDLQPSIRVDAVPYGKTPDYAPERDSQFDCGQVKQNEGDKSSRHLPSYVHEWECSELGEVGVVLWQADEVAGTIAFAVEFSSAGGGAGIGVSANGGMYGADLLVVRKQTSGEGSDWVLNDMFSKGYAQDGSLVTIDPIQDGKLLYAHEDDGRLAFIVSRPISSCDKEHDLEILSGPMPFVWARFPGHGHVYHGPGRQNRGTLYLNLLKQGTHDAGTIPEDADNLFTVDLRMLQENNQRYILPNGQVNTYACRSFELPSDQPYHVVSYEAILDTIDAAADVVHHIVMYSCDEDAMTPDPTECGSMAAMCQTVEIAWAVGMPPQYLPVEAGIPMKKYVLLEMHYENLGGEEDVKDGSGIRLTFTPQLRQHDFGYMIVGTSLSGTPALEPGQTDIVRQGYCPAKCLARHLPEAGVQVHGQFFHSHLQGRSLRTQHYRDGKELPHLGDMPYYDFNHQYFKYYGKEPRLMPGDTLVTTCVYDTKDRVSSTAFGLETMEEMCFNVIGHYPLINLQFCWNSTESGGYCMGEDGYTDGGFVESALRATDPRVEDTPERCLGNNGEGPAVDLLASQEPTDSAGARRGQIWLAFVLSAVFAGLI